MSAQKPWEMISNYESHELVIQRYVAKHGRTPNTAHAREIASSFIQARRYYEAAATADRAVKPLLLYYGILSLSRGLVLFLSRGLRAAALAQGHGLSVDDWQTVLSAQNPDITALKIVVNGSGSFPELLTATQNRGLLRAGSSAVNHTVTLDPVTAGAIFTLGELLERLPDVIDQLSRWRTPRCLRFASKPIAGTNEATVTVQRNKPYIDEHLVLDVIGATHCKVVTVDAKQVIVETTQAGKVPSIVTDHVPSNFLGIGDLLLAKPYTGGAKLSKAGQLFALSYIFSMLVRYHSAFWMDLVQQRSGDAALPTIYRVIDCLEDLFPQIVVDFLEE